MNITSISRAMARSLVEKLDKGPDEADVIRFGIEVLLGEGFKLFILLLTALYLRILGPTVTIYLTSGLLRLISGGVHLSTYHGCLIASTGTFLGLGAVSQVLAPSVQVDGLNWILGVTWMAGLLLVLGYAPADNPVKPIKSPGERKRLKILSLLFILFWGSAMLTLRVFLPDERTLVLASVFAVLFQGITLTPGAYRVAQWFARPKKGGDLIEEKA